MKVACVTLSRNQGSFLKEAIDSIVSQVGLQDYIVYDVGSTDSSRKIIEDFSDQVNTILVEKDGGPSDGLNACFEKTAGDILYYLNSDDRALKGSFDFAIRYFINHASCDVLHGSIRIIDQNGNDVGIKPSMDFSLRGYALGYSVVYQQATFFRREIFEKTKFNFENRTCWDGELIVDMALAGAEIHRTSKILGEFRIYSESITGSGRLKSQIEEDHRRISKKIYGRDLHRIEFIFGKIYAKIKAVFRIRYRFMRKSMCELTL
jgi:glycosyltransferase involved in cell wall biosynthesis